MVKKQLKPNLSYQLRKFRSAPYDYCEEAIVLKKQLEATPRNYPPSFS